MVSARGFSSTRGCAFTLRKNSGISFGSRVAAARPESLCPCSPHASDTGGRTSEAETSSESESAAAVSLILLFISLRVNFDGRHVFDEAFVNFPEARPHLLHLLAVLEVGAAALQDEVGRGRNLAQFE